MSDEYARLQGLLKALRPYDTKKDLLRAPSNVRKDYQLFRAFLKTDRRWAPKRFREEANKYRATALVFKSSKLNFDLSKTGYFDDNDKYKSSRKRIAKVTDALVKYDAKLERILETTQTIDVSYNKKSSRKVIKVDLAPDFSWSFLEALPDGFYVNINGTAYNKSGLDFLYDYHNKSEDFIKNLEPLMTDEYSISIYET